MPIMPCPHCEPHHADARHTAEKIRARAEPVFALLNVNDHLMRFFPPLFALANKLTLMLGIHLPMRLGYIQPIDAHPNDPHLYNRMRVIIDEAKTRGMRIRPLRIGNRTSNYATMHLPKTTIYFEGLPHLRLDKPIKHELDDKIALKRILAAHNIPHPRGIACSSPKKAIAFIENTIGFPAVVKPTHGSLSKHTTTNITDREQLLEAMRVARMLESTCIVEQHIEGDVFRAACVGGKLIAICKREAACVIGDGTHTIEQLIAVKNSNPARGDTHANNTTLHIIPITRTTHALLKQQHVALTDIPPSGRTIYLQTKITLAAGADIHDVTDIIHPENKLLIERAAAACDTPVIGIDLICADIAQPHHAQPFAIIEANTMPYIDMHHAPSTGTPRNVAAAILDYILAPQHTA